MGDYTPRAALDELLAGSGLRYEFANDRTISVHVEETISEPDGGLMQWPKHDANGVSAELGKGFGDRLEEDSSLRDVRLAQGRAYRRTTTDTQSTSGDDEQRERRVQIPEILVQGAKILNMDLRRSRDDAQPYVILDRTAIQQSGANQLDEFLKQRLPMNTTTASYSQSPATDKGNASSIDLRGLGTSQTLILVDGHRIASYSASGGAEQPDINSIPLAAIERIEVLPTTASGIYGGSATGGVVNIILRRDYSGVETKLTFDDTFHGTAPMRRADATAGFNFGGGNTNVLLAGSYADTDPLLAGDRTFVQESRERIVQNNPSFYLSRFTPPLGRTTNVRSLDGSPLTLKSGAPLLSPITSVPVGYGGIGTDGGVALVQHAGSYNLDLANTAQKDGGARQALLNSPTVKSASVTLRHQFSSRLQAFVDGGISENLGEFLTSNVSTSFTLPADAPGNPFEQVVRVTTPAIGADGRTISEIKGRRLVGGLIAKLPMDWQIEADYSWNRTRYFRFSPGDLNEEAAAAVQSGAIGIFSDSPTTDFSGYLAGPQTVEPTYTTLKDATLRLAGSVLELPAGPAAISILFEHRKEDLSDSVQPAALVLDPAVSQSVDSVYMEARVPIVSSSSAVPGVRLLELQLAGRYDSYETNGADRVFLDESGAASGPIVHRTNKFSSTNPTLGIRYQPVGDVMLRASYGTGFLPPTVSQIGGTFAFPDDGVFYELRDPRRGGEPVGAFNFIVGGNSALQPEESQSRSAGIVVTPRILKNFRVSLDWTEIRKTNNIQDLFGAAEGLQGIVDNESLFAGRVIRDPAPAGDPFGVGAIAGIDTSLINVAKAKVEAYDWAVDYRFDTSALGSFSLSLAATRLIHNENQASLFSSPTERVGTLAYLKWKANSSVTWNRGQWSAGWTTRYFDRSWLSSDHDFDLNQGAATIPSQIYHDLFVGWRVPPESMPLFTGLEIQLGAKNVLNKKPPIISSTAAANQGYLFYSPVGDPRLASYYLGLKAQLGGK